MFDNIQRLDVGLNGGLNGKFGAWLKRNVSYVVGVIAVAAIAETGGLFAPLILKYQGRLTRFLEDNMDGSFFQGRGSVQGNLTANEEAILDVWVVTRFTPFLEKITIGVNEALLSGSFTQQRANVNIELAKMCIIREYFALNEISNLSENAVQARLMLINDLFISVEEIIEEKLGSATSAKIVASGSLFKGLFLASVQGQSYTCRQYPAVSNTGVVIPASNTGTFPADNFSSDTKTDFAPIAIDTIDVIPTTTKPSTQTKVKAFNVMYLLAAISTVLIARKILKKSK